MKQTIDIHHYPNIIDGELKSEFDELNNETSFLTLHEIDVSGPKNGVEDLILHAYVTLGPEFWSAYLSGTLSTVTIDLVKNLLNKIGTSINGKKIKYLRSDGIKEVNVNYGLKAHPKKGYSIEFHANGNVTDGMLNKMFKHVEKLNKLNQSHFYDSYEVDSKGKCIKKKRPKK
jgi:hypothetical protein